MARSAKRRRTRGVVPQAGRWLGKGLAGAVRRPALLAMLAVLAVSGWGVWRIAQSSSLFRITQVLVPPEVSFRLPEPLLGRNVWEVDVQALAAELEAQAPGLKTVRVIRQLPDTLRVEVFPRIPLGAVRLVHGAARPSWYAVDAEGFVMPTAAPEQGEPLVRITGWERSGRLQVGKDRPNERLDLALRILQARQRHPAWLSPRLVELNVSEPQQIRLLVALAPASAFNLGAPNPALTDDPAAGTVEVRCGSEGELESNLRRLRASLERIGEPLPPIKYIDVRFPEPVIAPQS